ncbi:class I SAM-dependent methyltransferase [Salinirubellus sp. GCM10025818]|uniref:class I SAM-dependent methyltransferase n=1 Tax=Salinirubellus TaxID=2162630 RepID=UPI0030D1B512
MEPDEIRRQWAERSGEFSPDYYAYYGPDGRSDRILDLLGRYLDRSASVLELGCSSGRHLSHLYDHGFEDLSGIDVNAEAFEVMASAYPDLADAGTFYASTIEDVVGDFEDDRFDAVYSVQTLQHVHPDAAWVFEELVRITDDLLVTVEVENGNDGAGGSDRGNRSGSESGSENGDGGDLTAGVEVNYVREGVPLYYRDWNRVFTDLGLVEVERDEVGCDTLRAFRRG